MHAFFTLTAQLTHSRCIRRRIGRGGRSSRRRRLLHRILRRARRRFLVHRRRLRLRLRRSRSLLLLLHNRRNPRGVAANPGEIGADLIQIQESTAGFRRDVPPELAEHASLEIVRIAAAEEISAIGVRGGSPGGVRPILAVHARWRDRLQSCRGIRLHHRPATPVSARLKFVVPATSPFVNLCNSNLISSDCEQSATPTRICPFVNHLPDDKDHLSDGPLPSARLKALHAPTSLLLPSGSFCFLPDRNEVNMDINMPDASNLNFDDDGDDGNGDDDLLGYGHADLGFGGVRKNSSPQPPHAAVINSGASPSPSSASTSSARRKLRTSPLCRKPQLTPSHRPPESNTPFDPKP
ncbi:disease resistance protein [Striga asiatica]|uniref:Disease resistance protein n=1 Tax=Striga asiatica TaxID=4170 RepID=A0A5A7Q6J5_STRAF|nr:disease resistance protein [Striga asiatica]